MGKKNKLSRSSDALLTVSNDSLNVSNATWTAQSQNPTYSGATVIGSTAYIGYDADRIEEWMRKNRQKSLVARTGRRLLASRKKGSKSILVEHDAMEEILRLAAHAVKA